LSKRIEFLKVTRGKGWQTLDALVADLDRANYWKGEPERSPVEKRRHVRKMLATLVFRDDAVHPRVSDGSSPVGKHVFVSTTKPGASGEPVRVYKQVFDLASGEVRNVFEDKESTRAHRTKQAVQLLAKAYLEGSEAAEDVGTLLLKELAEETMLRAWPGLKPVERRRIVLAALIQHRHSQEALRTVSERCRTEGFDIGELLEEYLRAAEISPVVDPREADEIAESAAEYFKVVDELGDLNFGKMCLEVLMGARTNTVDEFSDREGIDFKEAATLFAGKLGEYADEFQGILEIYWRDTFGWTMNEHLQFAIERRGERGKAG
jgi:hypothetical protein